MDLKEIYLSYDMLEADLIKGLLEAHGIFCAVRDMTITPYPINIGLFGEKRIAVEEERVEEAVNLIRDARTDKYISTDGKFKDMNNS
ncbi:MAG: DUF2007 domain-containing protein [Thermodesulfobacteriota bacterium]